jgi:hypothetical protein
MTTPDAQAKLAAFAPVVASLAGKDMVAAVVVSLAGTHLADSLESAISAVAAPPSVPDAPAAPGVPAAAVGGLLQIPEVSAAFAAEIRRRGIDLTVASGTALDGALALGRHLAEGRALLARAPYLYCSA